MSLLNYIVSTIFIFISTGNSLIVYPIFIQMYFPNKIINELYKVSFLLIAYEIGRYINYVLSILIFNKYKRIFCSLKCYVWFVLIISTILSLCFGLTSCLYELLVIRLLLGLFTTHNNLNIIFNTLFNLNNKKNLQVYIQIIPNIVFIINFILGILIFDYNNYQKTLFEFNNKNITKIYSKLINNTFNKTNILNYNFNKTNLNHSNDLLIYSNNSYNNIKLLLEKNSLDIPNHNMLFYVSNKTYPPHFKIALIMTSLYILLMGILFFSKSLSFYDTSYGSMLYNQDTVAADSNQLSKNNKKMSIESNNYNTYNLEVSDNINKDAIKTNTRFNLIYNDTNKDNTQNISKLKISNNISSNKSSKFPTKSFTLTETKDDKVNDKHELKSKRSLILYSEPNISQDLEINNVKSSKLVNIKDNIKINMDGSSPGKNIFSSTAKLTKVSPQSVKSASFKSKKVVVNPEEIIKEEVNDKQTNKYFSVKSNSNNSENANKEKNNSLSKKSNFDKKIEDNNINKNNLKLINNLKKSSTAKLHSFSERESIDSSNASKIISSINDNGLNNKRDDINNILKKDNSNKYSDTLKSNKLNKVVSNLIHGSTDTSNNDTLNSNQKKQNLTNMFEFYVRKNTGSTQFNNDKSAFSIIKKNSKQSSLTIGDNFNQSTINDLNKNDEVFKLKNLNQNSILRRLLIIYANITLSNGVIFNVLIIYLYFEFSIRSFNDINNWKTLYLSFTIIYLLTTIYTLINVIYNNNKKPKNFTNDVDKLNSRKLSIEDNNNKSINKNEFIYSKYLISIFFVIILNLSIVIWIFSCKNLNKCNYILLIIGQIIFSLQIICSNYNYSQIIKCVSNFNYEIQYKFNSMHFLYTIPARCIGILLEYVLNYYFFDIKYNYSNIQHITYTNKNLIIDLKKYYENNILEFKLYQLFNKEYIEPKLDKFINGYIIIFISIIYVLNMCIINKIRY